MVPEIAQNKAPGAQRFRVGEIEPQGHIVGSNGLRQTPRIAQKIAAIVEQRRFDAPRTHGFVIDGERVRRTSKFLQR